MTAAIYINIAYAFNAPYIVLHKRYQISGYVSYLHIIDIDTVSGLPFILILLYFNVGIFIKRAVVKMKFTQNKLA